MISRRKLLQCALSGEEAENERVDNLFIEGAVDEEEEDDDDDDEEEEDDDEEEEDVFDSCVGIH